jgi:hypothetical protein
MDMRAAHFQVCNAVDAFSRVVPVLFHFLKINTNVKSASEGAETKLESPGTFDNFQRPTASNSRTGMMLQDQCEATAVMASRVVMMTAMFPWDGKQLSRVQDPNPQTSKKT